MKKGRRVSVSSTAVSNGMQGNAWMSQYLFSTKTKDQQEEAKGFKSKRTLKMAVVSSTSTSHPCCMPVPASKCEAHVSSKAHQCSALRREGLLLTITQLNHYLPLPLLPTQQQQQSSSS